jgi:AAA domain (dynein-related subfamily)
MPELSTAQLLESDSARRLLGALGQLGGQASPGQLADTAGLSASAVTKWLGRMREAQLVDGARRRPALTPEGWAAAGRPAITPGDSLQLGEAIARMPTEAHRAFLRLSLSAAVARWHLGARRREAHAGFIAGGATGTGKSSLARFVADALGLDWAIVHVQLRTATAGEVLGRLEQRDGGAYSFRPSPLLAEPVIVFDEFDKAERALQRDALVCFQGSTRAAREGFAFELRATPILTCNKQGELPVPAEYRRRSIVLDTDPLAPLLGDIDLRLRELQSAGGPPLLELATLTPPAAELPRAEFMLLRETLREGLSDEGWQLCEPRSIELTALGAAGGVADPDLEAFALQAAADYLTCAETVGETRRDWRARMPRQLAGEQLQTIESGASDREAIASGQRRQITEHAGESLALTGERQSFAEQLNLARPDARKIAPGHRPAAKALRAQLEQLRRQVLDCKSADALAALRELAAQPLAGAEQLHRQIADQHAAELAAAAEQRQQRELEVERKRRDREQRQRRAAAEKRAAADARRLAEQRAAAAGVELRQLRAEIARLEQLSQRTAGSPLEALRARSLIAFQPAPPRPPARTLSERLAALLPRGGWWYAPADPAVRFYGLAGGCPELEDWQAPATQRLLRDALGALGLKRARRSPMRCSTRSTMLRRASSPRSCAPTSSGSPIGSSTPPRPPRGSEG